MKINIDDPKAWAALDWDEPTVPEALKKTDSAINRGRANRLKAANPEFAKKFQGENNHNFGKTGELSPNYGKPGNFHRHSEETKKILSESHKGEKNSMFGKTHSEETKKILSEKNSGEKSVWYGKHHTEETKIKQSLAAKGKPKTDEWKIALKKGAAIRASIDENNSTCPHCQQTVYNANFTRFHGDKCWMKGKIIACYENNKKEATYSSVPELEAAGFFLMRVKECVRTPGKKNAGRTWKLLKK